MPRKGPSPEGDQVGQTVYLDKTVHDRLKKRADTEKRSFSAQAALYIERGLEAEGA